jgi:hypothetical protein
MAAVFGPNGPITNNLREPVANPRQVLSSRLARMKLEQIAEVIKKDDTEACKVRSGERKSTLSEFCDLLDAAGLKLVDKSRFCVKVEEFDFMRRMTARALANEQMARELTFEDPE